ncbi:MAG: hypothetical protein ACXWFX_16125 [Methylobacter sp.]
MDWVSLFTASATTTGLICDIYGAYLVADEVRNIFKGQTNFGVTPLGGSIHSWSNPKYVEHEQKKRKTMKRGLKWLYAGFGIQMVSAWIPIAIKVFA